MAWVHGIPTCSGNILLLVILVLNYTRKIVQEGGSWYGKNCFVQGVNLIYVTGQQRCISTYFSKYQGITNVGGLTHFDVLVLDPKSALSFRWASRPLSLYMMPQIHGGSWVHSLKACHAARCHCGNRLTRGHPPLTWKACRGMDIWREINWNQWFFGMLHDATV